MSPKPPFPGFWQNLNARNTLLSFLDKDDTASLRLTCRDCSNGAAPILFKQLHITFRAATFTRHANMAALERIGHHVKTFHFSMPHSNETFLPPLIESTSGEEVTFVYEPYTRLERDATLRQSLPSYGSWEMTDLLVRQYPPLFHAAANVPSFIKAFSTMPNVTHLKISCPSQDPSQRNRRSIVDYALISIRIAIERNRLKCLGSLSLLDVHPAASMYLNPRSGFGALPSSARRWQQIRRLKIRMQSSCSEGATSHDHLKHLHAYLGLFSPSLRRLDFKWLGERSPCPTMLNAETILKTPSPAAACPLTRHRTLQPIKFSRLRDCKLENMVTDAAHVARFIARHHGAVRHTSRLRLKFNDTLLRAGTWDEALAPLTQMSGSDSWKSSSEESADERPEGHVEEFMEVPIMFSPAEERHDVLHKVWDDFEASRSFKPYSSRVISLQRAGARTKEFILGTDVRRLLSSTVFGWR